MPPRKLIEKKGPLIIQGFTVVQVKASSRSHSAHCLYLKEHKSPHAQTEWPSGRTLLVHNVPSYCKEENLKLVFQKCGGILRINLQPKLSSAPLRPNLFCPKETTAGSQVAYIVFRKPGALTSACALPFDNVLMLSDETVPIVSGLKGYINDYEAAIVDVAGLETAAEQFMENYYKKQEELQKQEKEQEGVPDDEGFIKVTRHGKNKGGRRTEETQRRGQDHIRSRKKKNELQDFYTFQFRETKRKHIAELQAKFEEDKQKVQQMKTARKFKPY